LEDAPFAAGTGQLARVLGGDRGAPVDGGHRSDAFLPLVPCSMNRLVKSLAGADEVSVSGLASGGVAVPVTGVGAASQ
jgi:hypothetical protein